MPRTKTPRSATSTSRIKQALPTPQFNAVPEPRIDQRQRKDLRNDSAVDIQAEIRRRAYELYQERGCMPGFEQEDWVVAEREILVRYSLQAV